MVVYVEEFFVDLGLDWRWVQVELSEERRGWERGRANEEKKLASRFPVPSGPASKLLTELLAFENEENSVDEFPPLDEVVD